MLDKQVLPGPGQSKPRTAGGCGGKAPRSSMGWRRAVVLVVVHIVLLVHIALWLRRGESLTPLEPSEAGETLLTGAVNAGFLLFSSALVLTLVVGRFFCGWACHVVAYQDLARWILGRIGLEPRPVRSRLLLCVPFYAAFSMFLWPSIQKYWIANESLPALTWHLTTADFWERFPGPGVTVVTLVVCGGMVVWFLGAKGFCTYACPYGAFFGFVGRHAPGRIRVNSDCEGCGHCTAVCTSEVRVHSEVARFGQVIDAACMRCLDCVSACPKDALSFGFGRDPSAKAKGRMGLLARMTRPPKEFARWDFTWPEELCMAVVFGVTVWSLRGAYGLVPFLLALGLSVLMALAVITFLRLLSKSDLQVQHSTLRRGGRLQPLGWGVLLLVPLSLALVGETGWVQAHAQKGERLLVQLAQTKDKSEYESLREQALVQLEVASRWALVDSFKLENQLGQVLARAGRASDAQKHLERAVALEPDSLSARVELAWVFARRGEPASAASVLKPIQEAGVHDGNYLRAVDLMFQRYPADPELLSLVESLKLLLGESSPGASSGSSSVR